MIKWADKREIYYDKKTGDLYLENVFGIASFLCTPFGLLAMQDDPFFFIMIGFGLGIAGLITGIITLIGSIRWGSEKRAIMSSFGIVASLAGIVVAVVAFIKFVL